MKKKLWELTATAGMGITNPIVVVSGAQVSRIEEQMDGVPCIKMGQNGNDAPDWCNKLNKKEEEEVLSHLNKISKYFVAVN